MQSHLDPSTATQDEAKSEFAPQEKITQLEATKKIIRDMIGQYTAESNPLVDKKDKQFIARSDVKPIILDCLNIHTRLYVLYERINLLREQTRKNNPNGVLMKVFTHLISSLSITTLMKAWEADADKDYSHDFNQLAIILKRKNQEVTDLAQKLDETIAELNETRHELDQSRVHNVSQSAISAPAALFQSAANNDKKILMLAIGLGRAKVIAELIKLKQGADAEVIKNMDAIICILLKDACLLVPNKMTDLAREFPVCPQEITALLEVSEEQLLNLKDDNKKKAIRTISAVLKSKAYIALNDSSVQEIREFARGEYNKIGTEEHKASQQQGYVGPRLVASSSKNQ